jgi:3'-5' exoribonuclease Rv2179c-like domain
MPIVEENQDVERKSHNSVDTTERTFDVYFSADVETDGPIFDGARYNRPDRFDKGFYRELKPISNDFQEEALRVNGLDRVRLCREGQSPETAMTDAANWVKQIAGAGKPVLVAYPLCFDWAWLYWYFIRFSTYGSPFNHSRCFDIKTAFALKASLPIAKASRSKLLAWLRPNRPHTHNALDDATEQAEIFANIFQWEGRLGGTP